MLLYSVHGGSIVSINTIRWQTYINISIKLISWDHSNSLIRRMWSFGAIIYSECDGSTLCHLDNGVYTNVRQHYRQSILSIIWIDILIKWLKHFPPCIPVLVLSSSNEFVLKVKRLSKVNTDCVTWWKFFRLCWNLWLHNLYVKLVLLQIHFTSGHTRKVGLSTFLSIPSIVDLTSTNKLSFNI